MFNALPCGSTLTPNSKARTVTTKRSNCENFASRSRRCSMSRFLPVAAVVEPPHGMEFIGQIQPRSATSSFQSHGLGRQEEELAYRKAPIFGTNRRDLLGTVPPAPAARHPVVLRVEVECSVDVCSVK